MAYIPQGEWRSQASTSSDYFSRDLTREVGELCESFKAPTLQPWSKISQVLKPRYLRSLESLPTPRNGKCDLESLLSNPVSKALITIMGEISLSNSWYSLSPDRLVASLKNEEAEDMYVPPHRDLLDGHAVLFNWGVSGDLMYGIDDLEFPVASNEIVALNGAADWLDITTAVQEDAPKDLWRFGGVTAVHSVIGRGVTSRNRLLVYVDGQETVRTQIYVDEYGPGNLMKDNLLVTGLRPSLGIYVE